MIHKVRGIGDLYAQKLQERALLQTGPSNKGLFTDEGILWAQSKKKEKIHEYPIQELSREVCDDVEGALCWAFEMAAQEKQREIDWH